MNAKTCYENDKDFKTYVDKYSTQHDLDIDTALKHRMVLNYMDYLMDKKKGKSNDIIHMYT